MSRRHKWAFSKHDVCLKCGLRRQFGDYPDPRNKGSVLYKHDYFRDGTYIGTRPDECRPRGGA